MLFGFADIVGFAGDGTYVSLGQANGTFGALIFATAQFGLGQGWSSSTVVRDSTRLVRITPDRLATAVSVSIGSKAVSIT